MFELKRPTEENHAPKGIAATAPLLPRARQCPPLQSSRTCWDGTPYTIFDHGTTCRDIGTTVLPSCTSGFFHFEPFSVVSASEAARQAAITESLNLKASKSLSRKKTPPLGHSLSPSSARSPLSKFGRFRALGSPANHNLLYGLDATPAENLPAKHPFFRPIRHMPVYRAKSLLSSARDFAHKEEILRLHPELRPKLEKKNISSDPDRKEKIVLLKIKSWIHNKTAVSSWDPNKPIADWKRVTVTRNGNHVTGLSLVSTGLTVDLLELGLELQKLPKLTSLMIHGNPHVKGDLTHLAVLIEVEEIRIGGQIEGSLLALAGLFHLKKLRIYNRTKHLTGLQSDLQTQLPNCDIKIENKPKDE